MARVKSRDTGPEMIVRRALHAAGYRYRLHERKLPGTPDIVFPARRSVVFVHGCFWHGHTDCRLASTPKTRTEFWLTKIEGNRARDLRVHRELEALGWRVHIVWQCTTKNGENLIAQIRELLEGFTSRLPAAASARLDMVV